LGWLYADIRARERDGAVRQAEHYRRDAYALRLAAVAAVAEDSPSQGAAQLNDAAHCPPDLRDFTWRHFARVCNPVRATLTGYDLSPVPFSLAPGGPAASAPRGDPRGPICVTLAPDGSPVAARADKGAVRLIDPATGKDLMPLRGLTSPVRAMS